MATPTRSTAKPKGFFSAIFSVLLVFFVIKACFFKSGNTNSEYDKELPPISFMQIPDSVKAMYEIIALPKKFTVRRHGNGELINTNNHRYLVYVRDTTKIDIVNSFFTQFYNPGNSNYLYIYYYDDREVAFNFDNDEANKNLSAERRNAIKKHFIASYFCNPSNKISRLDYLNK